MMLKYKDQSLKMERKIEEEMGGGTRGGDEGEWKEQRTGERRG